MVGSQPAQASFITNTKLTFPIDLGEGVNPAAGMAVADFNGDGWPDAVFTNASGISRLYGRAVPQVTVGALTFSGSGTKTVTVKNTLPVAQAVRAALPDTGSAFRITADTCLGTLAAGATCAVTVEYASQGGPAADTVYIRANGVIVARVGVSGD